MKAFVRVFIILGAIGAMVSVALPALAGVGPPAEDALCLSDCAKAFGKCKSGCGIVCEGPQCVPACGVLCAELVVDCVAGCATCGNGVVEPPVEQCEPPNSPGGAHCSALRFCDANCRCAPVGAD